MSERRKLIPDEESVRAFMDLVRETGESGLTGRHRRTESGKGSMVGGFRVRGSQRRRPIPE